MCNGTEEKVDDAGDEEDKEQGEPKGSRPQGPCWHCGGLIFSVIALTKMMKGKRRLALWGDQDHFPDQQYNNGTHGSGNSPKDQGKGK